MPGADAARDAGALAGRAVLLTGASGFLGGHLVDALTGAGARVVAPTRRAVATAGEVRWIPTPEWSPEALVAALRDLEWDAVVHAAAYGAAPFDRDPVISTNVNAFCSAALARLAAERGAAAYVHLGSWSEYDPVGASMPLAPDAPVETAKIYGATKLAGTALSRAIAAAAGMPFAAARVFSAYGPGEGAHRLLPSLVRDLAANRPVRLSDGRQVRDFVYAGDVAAAILAMLAALMSGRGEPGIYNVASGVGASVRDVALAAAAALGAEPGLLQFGALPQRPDEVPAVVGDPSETERVFGWRARTTLQQGVAKSVKAMLDDLSRGSQTAMG